MFSEINYRAKRKETVITIFIVTIIISCVLSFRLSQIILWPIYLSMPILFLGLLNLTIGNAITWLWFRIMLSVGWFSSKVVLGIFYLIFICPYSIILRFIGKKDFLILKRKESTFSRRTHRFKSDDLDNPW